MKILKVFTRQREIGNLGERAAVKFLRKAGYKILKKNYVALGAEIDVIAKKDKTTAFIEVKTRNVKHLGYKESRPGASVTPEKQRKIIKTAGFYNAHHPDGNKLRFDVIEVYTEDTAKGVKVLEIKHLVGCFDKTSAFDKAYHYKRSKEGSVL